MKQNDFLLFGVNIFTEITLLSSSRAFFVVCLCFSVVYPYGQWGYPEKIYKMQPNHFYILFPMKDLGLCIYALKHFNNCLKDALYLFLIIFQGQIDSLQFNRNPAKIQHFVRKFRRHSQLSFQHFLSWIGMLWS